MIDDTARLLEIANDNQLRNEETPEGQDDDFSLPND